MSSQSASEAAGNTASPWKIGILATTTENQESKPYTLYVISIHYTVPSELRQPNDPTVVDWTLNHRYSDFEALRSKLLEYSNAVPALPGKSWFGSLSNDLINARKVGLNAFLSECAQRTWCQQLWEWRDFLQIQNHVAPRLLYEWLPLEIKSVRNSTLTGSSGANESYGVNDFVYDPTQLVLILGMEEQRLLQKVENAVSSIRMPWAKTAPARPLPLGCIKIHRVNGDGVWKNMCAVTSVAGVCCLNFQLDSLQLLAGLDDGTINVYKVDPNFIELELKREVRLHDKQRVTSVYFHRKYQYILSTSRDKTFVIWDMRKEFCLSSTVVGASVNAAAWVSAMEVDEDQDRVFLGTYAQHIHIYDISTPTQPRFLHTLEGHTGSVRCLHFRPAERYLFSGGFDAAAAIWSVPAGGPEAVLRARSVGWLKEGSNQKVKSIVFIPPAKGVENSGSQGMVVTGLDGGYINIYDIGSGRLKYSHKSHASDVVKLVYLPTPDQNGVLLSAGLDGCVKFFSIPSKPTAGGGNNDSEEVKAFSGLNLGNKSQGSPSPVAASGSSSSASLSPAAAAALREEQARKFSTSPSGTKAPPPSMAAAGSLLHKSSRADSTDGVTLFSSSYADSREEVRSTKTSFFQDDDEDDAASSAAAAAFMKSPQRPGASSSKTSPGSKQRDDDGSGEAVEVPAKIQEEEDEPDIF